ncbi:MAG: hypothetical protein AUI36_43495 [Cyanobacteria bacterium 13_1_40CM_2_61_4]|nr:MAG: hypothetical protein AUI36_43495 [Cyanobacteria bacterium 13_1_40CM_2_61_4]
MRAIIGFYRGIAAAFRKMAKTSRTTTAKGQRDVRLTRWGRRARLSGEGEAQNGNSGLAEIGVWHGVTTCRLRSKMASDGVLFAVDPYPIGCLGFSAQRYIARKELGRGSKTPSGAAKSHQKSAIEV